MKVSLNNFSARLAAIFLISLAAGLSIAIISIAKLLLLLLALVALTVTQKNVLPAAQVVKNVHTTLGVLGILSVFFLSLLWTAAPFDQAMTALGKYGKLIVIPLIVLLVRSRSEASIMLIAFLCGQVFLLLSSWLLYFEIPVPWATSRWATTSFAVFSTYLDQGIISAAVAAIFWHLRALAPSKPLYLCAIIFSMLALGNVFIVLAGRTGHIVGMAMVSLAIFWALPRKYRLLSLLAPPLIFLIAVLSFGKVSDRFLMVKTEVSAYWKNPEMTTSSGVRLTFWKTSTQLIANTPLAGSGVGSWTTEFNNFEGNRNKAFASLNAGGNPHQEFLLWGVQLGVPGILLLLLLFLVIALDFRKFDPAIARAGQSVVVALIISCSLNSSIYDAHIGDFFCISLGVLLAYGTIFSSPNPRRASNIN